MKLSKEGNDQETGFVRVRTFKELEEKYPVYADTKKLEIAKSELPGRLATAKNVLTPEEFERYAPLLEEHLVMVVNGLGGNMPDEDHKFYQEMGTKIRTR